MRNAREMTTKPELEIGKALQLTVRYYDSVPEPPKEETYEGEVLGWHQSQVVVRVPGYAVLKFWKRNGLEVGNKDWVRRGFRIDVEQLHGLNSGVKVDFTDG